MAGLAPEVTSAATPAVPVAVLDVAGTPPTDPAAEDNPFMPEDKNLSECVSAVPEPGCGSEARGGWRQGIVLAVVVVALAFVGWQIIRTVRRSRRVIDVSPGVEEPAGGRRGS